MTTGARPLSLPPQSQQMIADSAAAVSVTTAAWTWVAAANEVLQLVATLVAIVAGIAAANFHIRKTIALRKGPEGNAD